MLTTCCWQVLSGPTTEEAEDKDEVESILLEPRHQWWNLWALFKRVFRSHRFKVRALYLYLKKNPGNNPQLTNIVKYQCINEVYTFYLL